MQFEATRSSEMSVLTRTTQLHIRKYGILHIHRSENLKYYTFQSGLPPLDDGDDCGAIGGINELQGTPKPLCPPQIPQDMPGSRTRAA
jgi:hypothetical protein